VSVMGLDLSLTGSGVVVLDGAGPPVVAETLSNKLRGMERLGSLRDRIGALVSAWRPALICIEGYNRGAKNGREEAGELSGVVRLMLHRNGFKYVLASPGQVKKFATGKGVAEKSLMMMTVFKKWGFEPKTDDEADAMSLAKIAYALQGGQPVMTAYEMEVIEAIRNPAEKPKRKSK
jgi:crossover junction endodeoxyribonuclease RuvC